MGVNDGTQGLSKWTELFIVRARVLGRILKDVGRASGKTAVRKDARLDFLRVDLREMREAAGAKVRPALGEMGGAAGRVGGQRQMSMRRGSAREGRGDGWTYLRSDIRRRPSMISWIA